MEKESAVSSKTSEINGFVSAAVRKFGTLAIKIYCILQNLDRTYEQLICLIGYMYYYVMNE